MLFEKKFNYYMIKFDVEKTYWYRSNSAFHRIGAKVNVPISNNGKWKIGTIAGKQQFKTKEVPYPIYNRNKRNSSGISYVLGS